MLGINSPPSPGKEIIRNPIRMEPKKRVSPRISSRVPIKCRPNTSYGGFCDTDGTMRNYSIQGAYIETSKKYNPGTILIVRTILTPSVSFFTDTEKQPPSLCLAEVKWLKNIREEYTVRFGMGLRYLF